MVNKARVVVVPPSFYKLAPERQKATKAIREPSGQFSGRRVVSKERSDKTKVIRMVKPYDVNKDKKITPSQDFLSGQIIGRVSSGETPKRVEVTRHYRKGKTVRPHVRIMR